MLYSKNGKIMEDYEEEEEMGCSVNIIFIIVEIIIGYMAFTTDKTGFIAIALVAYFIYKAIKDSISKI